MSQSAINALTGLFVITGGLVWLFVAVVVVASGLSWLFGAISEAAYDAYFERKARKQATLSGEEREG